ncbi:MAG TPA: glycosyltransferase family 9 protein, partial [Sphingomonas sp.]|nr:glycosyltransferase family 9 protein [Sphingomonas sp.]
HNGRLDEGEALLRKVVAARPDRADSRHALGVNLLSQGRYREAWLYHDARIDRTGLDDGYPRDFAYPRWRGEDLTGKRIVIFPDQGFGDQIQFVRFVPELVKRGAEVMLLTHPALFHLFQHNFPDIQLLMADGAVEFPDPDYWAALADLPGMLQIGLEDVSGELYLRAPATASIPGDEFKVGLKLKGSPKHRNDAGRSLSGASAEKLRAGLAGKVISLEPEDTGARDFAQTAAIIAALDLVVSVDTSVAHLAGALGIPCLLLVQGIEPDWRWMFGRADSPWYANHRLYRGDPDGSWDKAIERLLAHVRWASAPTRLHTRRAAALREEGRFADAVAAGRSAIAADPHNATALHNLGRLLTDLGRLKDGEAMQRRALQVDPQAAPPQFGLALNLLAQGRYSEAWPLYEARMRLPHLKIGLPEGIAFPRWRGEDIGGERIAVFTDQGFGDQIQFARFLPWLAARCAEIVLIAPPALVRLFQGAFPDVRIVPAVGSTQVPKCAVWTMLSDLAVLADARLEALPPGDYLRRPRPDPAHAGFRVGIMTKGNQAFVHDAYRTLPADLAASLRTRLPGSIVDLDPEISGACDFADTADIIAGLDLVVSVDTSVAHLAGALATTCLLLVPGFATDWRWMRERDDTLWYPHHRLHRGTPDGRWESAIDNAVADARRLAGGGTPVEPGIWAGEIRSRRKAVATAPTQAAPRRQLGGLLTEIGALKEGEAALREAVALAGAQADSERYALALNLLAQGRYRDAWPFYAARRGLRELGIAYPAGISGPRWEGQSLEGARLLVLAEQGLGDTLQLARFLPSLVERGAAVTLFERPPLSGLLRTAFPSIIVCDDIGAIGHQDLWTTTFDMLEPLDIASDTLAPADYLASLAPPRQPGAPFTIGLCTAGNPAHPNDARRSLSAATAAQLRAKLPGTIVDTRPEATGARDFTDTAAILAELDLVVSVDTAIAHLAGAMGKSCLLLLPGKATDWRWMRGRRDSPWYPRHMLFRSDLDGDWRTTIEAVAAQAEQIRAGA